MKRSLEEMNAILTMLNIEWLCNARDGSWSLMSNIVAEDGSAQEIANALGYYPTKGEVFERFMDKVRDDNRA